MTTSVGGGQVTAKGWTPDLGQFGVRLALVRQRMGWNVAEAERACGLGRGSWALWEQGREPSRFITICMQIAGATGVDIDWLVYGPDKATPVVIADPSITNRYSPELGPDLLVDPLAARVLSPRERSADVGQRLLPARPVTATRPIRRSDARQGLVGAAR